MIIIQTNRIRLISIFIMSLLMFYSLGCIFNEEDTENNTEKEVGITALEGKVLSDEKALEWDENATLVFVDSFRNMVDEGSYPQWLYIYWNSTESDNASAIFVRVFSNGSIGWGESKIYTGHLPILNWSVDSNEAYRIAKNDSEIGDWLSQDWKRIRIDIFTLYGGKNKSNPYWHIAWLGGENPEHYSNAYINIDANTSVILDLYASGSPRKSNETTFPTIVPTILIITVVALSSKINREGNKNSSKIRLISDNSFSSE